LGDFDAETSGSNSGNSNSRGSKLEGQIVAIFTGLKVHMFSSICATNTRNGVLVSDGKGVSVALSRFRHTVCGSSGGRLKKCARQTCEMK